MILADSNIIIYVTSGIDPELTSWFLDNEPSVSAVSMVEVLGYHNLKSATALHHGLTLATHDTKDFEWIKALEVIDPLEG
jgi:predicted nucleic acid-binding protein